MGLANIIKCKRKNPELEQKYSEMPEKITIEGNSHVTTCKLVPKQYEIV